MFGKGAKRKLDEEDDEGLEGQALAPPVAPGAAGGPGLRWPEGPSSKVSYTLQRQTIFNISLMKLMYSHRSPPAEPRLERRVLINNMLRRIQEELKQEGALRPQLLLLPPSPPPDDPMDETFREAPPAGATGPATPAPAAPVSPLPAPPPPSLAPPPPPPTPPPHTAAPAGPAPMEACLTPASLLEDDVAFCTLVPPTLPLSPPPTPPNCQPAAGPPPLLLPPLRGPSSHGGVGFFPPAPASLAPGPPAAIAKTAAANTTTTSPALPQPPLPLRDSRTTGPRAEVAVVSPSVDGGAPTAAPPSSVGVASDVAPASHPYPPAPPSPSGFLSDLALDDILFADIDTSMYDFDACTTAGAVTAKLSPAVTADDLLKSLTSPYAVAPAPQVSANQPFKIDLTELDHIMEVLVGS
ncbi:hypothetical protein NHX12_022141 [Muraenolepis orangiensis]|uniref:SERTA domain-containing protein n=1 Tax=Muraenolepis orangiensis TaxID=630683 RepID=A0A9Q0IR25_9TELE|nr:hypothetical protein NHX12_022141 [Muraenolepis orangiensis]